MNFTTEISLTLDYTESTAGMIGNGTITTVTEPTDSPGNFSFSSVSLLVLTVVITIVAVVGILGNVMVIFIVFRYKDMHTVINYSFANLALTDLTLLILDAVPTAADSIGINLSASFGCNVPIYLQYVAAEVTSLTLAFLSYDRYRLIVHPIKTLNRRTPKTLALIFFVIWIASFVIQIPTVLVPGVTPDGACSEYNAPWGQEIFFSFATATLFCIPTAIIMFCYARMGRKMLSAGPTSSMKASRRRRSVNTILMVIVLYTLCWIPCHAVHMWMAFDPYTNAKTPLYIELHTAANVLIFFNSSVNPFVYTLVGQTFRNHVKEIFLFPKYLFSGHLKKGESKLSLYKPNDQKGDASRKKNIPFSSSVSGDAVHDSTWL